MTRQEALQFFQRVARHNLTTRVREDLWRRQRRWPGGFAFETGRATFSESFLFREEVCRYLNVRWTAGCAHEAHFFSAREAGSPTTAVVSFLLLSTSTYSSTVMQMTLALIVRVNCHETHESSVERGHHKPRYTQNKEHGPTKAKAARRRHEHRVRDNACNRITHTQRTSREEQAKCIIQMRVGKPTQLARPNVVTPSRC